MAIKFPALPKGVPLGELSGVAKLRGYSPIKNTLPGSPQTVRQCAIHRENHKLCLWENRAVALKR